MIDELERSFIINELTALFEDYEALISEPQIQLVNEHTAEVIKANHDLIDTFQTRINEILKMYEKADCLKIGIEIGKNYGNT
jgi:predicted DNA-binding protein YlxM (UPF0122 family)|tara:strand:+ start:3312 stop:3557 length:246 start_codon:yes stop_codon:yes gene_type:complete